MPDVLFVDAVPTNERKTRKMTKNYSFTLKLEISDFEAENKDRAIEILNDFLDAIDNLPSRISWDEADWRTFEGGELIEDYAGGN